MSAYASNSKSTRQHGDSAVDAKAEAVIDEIDRAIIVATQQGLPLVSQPYHKVADEIGIDANEVMARMRRMLELGIIRRIAAVPNHYKLGFTANGMSVWDIDDEQVQSVGNKMGNLDFVSHCYHRPRHLPDWSYNVFAMVHGRNREEVLQHIKAIEQLVAEHCRSHDVLFSTAILKKTGLRISQNTKGSRRNVNLF